MNKRHTLPYDKKNEVLTWLTENVQDNFNDALGKYDMNSVSQFVEWRSKDLESWILRVAGFPPQLFIEIKDPEKETWFLLRWK